MVFKTGKLDEVEDVIKSVLPGDKLAAVQSREKLSTPIIANAGNMNEILSNNDYVVAGFYPPGEKRGIKFFNELARKYRDKVTFTLSTDRVLFNETSRTFYRNPLFVRFDVILDSEVILFHQGMIHERGDYSTRISLTAKIEELLAMGDPKDPGKRKGGSGTGKGSGSGTSASDGRSGIGGAGEVRKGQKTRRVKKKSENPKMSATKERKESGSQKSKSKAGRT